MAAAPLGLQLIVFGGQQNEDLPGVLADVKNAGYDGAETGILHTVMGADTVINIFADAGLAMTGIHCGYRDLVEGTRVHDLIEFMQDAGCRHLICSGVSDPTMVAGYEESAETFNEVGQWCKDAGLVFCYHNHAWEFEPLEGGAQGMQLLGERTSPELVKFCIDVYWVTIGGENPVEFINRHLDRGGYYHFKDGEKTANGPAFIELGQGAVDLPGAREALMQGPVEWIICEQDRTVKEPEESIRESFAYLKHIGF